MSLFGALRTSVSGMNAQSNKLGAVAQNVANVGTTGYKSASTEFETVLGRSAAADYASGSVVSVSREAVSRQGSLTKTSNATDLAISGKGYFVVSNSAGATLLTRAGAFTPDKDGDLVNAAGYALMGVDLSKYPNGVAANGTASLTKVNVDQSALKANPSSAGTLSVNLNSDATAVASGSTAASNTASSTYTSKTSLTTYDDLGHKVTLDVYFTKTGANTWEEAVYDASTAASGGGFPYSSGPITTQSLGFSATTGKLTSPTGGAVSVAIPNGGTVKLDEGATTQLAAAFTVVKASVDGNAASAFDHVDVDEGGTVSAVYADGDRVALYKLALGTAVSPDRLEPVAGDAYAASADSGAITLGSANAGLGAIEAGSLEDSTVDLGTELTTMIETQRAYTANSKVFQAGADMLDMLMNLKV